MKIDCSNLLNFCSEERRMCSAQLNCSKCEFKKYCDELILGHASNSIFKFSEEFLLGAIQTIQKWSNDNPMVTYFDDFQKKYPDADLGEVKNNLCPKILGYGIDDFCDCENCLKEPKCRKTCWNMIIPESED